MNNLRFPVHPLAALLAVLLSLLPGWAAAHQVPGTVIALDVQPSAVKATVQVPLSELRLGTVGWVRLPGTLTELLIAVSVLVSAAHALRPIFPGRELYVAAGFGLIHGLAFSGTLAQLHLAPWQTALGLLGFNLGIESM